MLNNNGNEVRAGFFVRLAACVIDMIIVFVATSILKIPFWVAALVNPQNIVVRDFIFTYSIQDIFFYCLQVSYFIVLTYKTGSTIGKKLLKLKVVGDDSELTLFDVIFRETVGRFLSTLISFVGYILIGIDKNKKGLHDILSDTKVVYVFNETSQKSDKPIQVEGQLPESRSEFEENLEIKTEQFIEN